MPVMNKAWFDLRSQVKRTYAQAVWIPLCIYHSESQGEYNIPGYQSSFEGAHSIVVPLKGKDLGERYSWSDDHEPRPWAEEGFYQPADVYSHDLGHEIGFRLALRQNIADQPHTIWHLHQDFVLALGLMKDADTWVRPAEGYAEVARLRRDSKGDPVGIEVKAEFLRDYLAARGAALRIASYRSRTGVVAQLGDIDFPADPDEQIVHGGRLEERSWAIDRSGSHFGSSVAVFKVSRNDIDPDDDVPVMGPDTKENIDSISSRFTRNDGKLHQVMAEFWRDEWVEPGLLSPRVREDHVPSEVTFIVEADGTRMNADDLNREDIGRWLWFKPGIVSSHLARRGARIDWYTQDTGGFSTPSDPSVHFGINESGLITVYAQDVARLPEWERRLWAGFNVTPEGKVSAELLSAQVRAVVAKTQAPEAFFSRGLELIKRSWRDRYGTELFRQHDQEDTILAGIHRFRAIDRLGLFALAKDVARLTADSIDVSVAQAAVAPPKGQKPGSLKSLERVLASLSDDETARAVMGPLFATYDLRLSDAHLPKTDLQTSLQLLGIEPGDLPIDEGGQLLSAVVSALFNCAKILNHPPASAPFATARPEDG